MYVVARYVATTYFSFLLYSYVFELLFQVGGEQSSHNLYELQPTAAANDRLLILCDHTLLQLDTY